jgi:hypothetical protein
VPALTSRVLRGYVRVAPIEHRESAVSDFSREEDPALHEVMHRVGRALEWPGRALILVGLGHGEYWCGGQFHAVDPGCVVLCLADESRPA